jgi:hypothetical protein
VHKAPAFIILLLAAVMAPLGALGEDLTPPNGDPGEDCVSSPATDQNNLPKTEDTVGAGPGRGSLCISDGKQNNGNELYVGGDFNRLQNGDPANQCLHVEVAGQVIWRRPNYPVNNPDRFCH